MSKINNKETLEILAKQVRSGIIHMTSLANSGHPAGPLGFVETFLLTLDSLSLNPSNPYDPSKDKLVISFGHYSALVYNAIAALLLPKDKHDLIVAKFRSPDDVVEGHVTHHFPFIWDSTGHLGYGLSIAAGHSLADRLWGYNKTQIVCFMGDGEQTEGTIQESARFITKYKLDNISVIVDVNGQQLSGSTGKIMPMDIGGNFKANGWAVHSIDGYDMDKINSELRIVRSVAEKGSNVNIAVLVNTIMGKGVKETEGTHEYHGKPVKDFKAAIADLGVEDRLEHYKKLRESPQTTGFEGRPLIKPVVSAGQRVVYTEKTDCRSAWGNALVDISRSTLNENGIPKEGYSPIAVFDCDLAGSVKTDGFEKAFPNNFFQAGIQEHSTAITVGTLSTRGVLTWLAMFGSFGHSMTYNGHMLTAMNDGNLKLVTTHNSIDVGEDSKTHSPISYLSLSNHPGWQNFCPADANQTDAMVRYMATNPGNMHLATGRSKLDIIKKQGNNEPFFGKDYEFKPGTFDILRDYGDNAVIVTYGTVAGRAVEAAKALNEEGIGIKVINVPTPKVIPRGVAELAAKAGVVVSFEDHYVEEGISDKLNTALLGYHLSTKTSPDYQRRSIGMEGYSKSGTSDQLYKHFGINKGRLVSLIKEALGK